MVVIIAMRHEVRLIFSPTLHMRSHFFSYVPNGDSPCFWSTLGRVSKDRMCSICSIGSFFHFRGKNLEYYTWIFSFALIYISPSFPHFIVFTFLKHILHVPGCHISKFNPPITCVQYGLHFYDVRFNFHLYVFQSSASLLFHFPLLSFHLFHEPLYLCIALTICRESFFIMSFKFLEEILLNISMCFVAKLLCSMSICFLFSYSFSPLPFL